MTCSAARRLHGRQRLKLILSEESRVRAGCARQPESEGPPPARTAANFFGPADDERMSKRASIGLVFAFCLAVWAVVMAPVVWVLS
jgi:hypothetical protein